MSLLAQGGHADGKKTQNGLADGSIRGVIFSPRYLLPNSMKTKMEKLLDEFRDADILLDPEYYSSIWSTLPNLTTGKLCDWEYFSACRRSDLEDIERVDTVIRECVGCQSQFPVSRIVTPNIFVSERLDSLEGGISRQFIRRSTKVAREFSDLPILCSIILSESVFQDRMVFQEFLETITDIDPRPDGFYIVVGSNLEEDSAFNSMNSESISGWMFMNHVLGHYDFEVINGYSDILTPFLCLAGGRSGATGWNQKQRHFSQSNWIARTGGSLPVQRYLSKALMNRITEVEYDALKSLYPAIENRLPHDAEYTPAPARAREVLQSWGAISSMCDDFKRKESLADRIQCMEDACSASLELYSNIRERIRLDPKSNDRLVQMLSQAAGGFKRYLEI